MNIWEQRLNHTILFTIVKGLLQVYLSTEDMALEKSSILLFWCKFDWKSQPTIKKILDLVSDMHILII